MGEKKILLLNFLIEINYQEIFHTNNKVKNVLIITSFLLL